MAGAVLDIREELPGDVAAIREVVSRACGTPEADLVDRLRANGAALLSLVATLDDQVVGHILFSPATIQHVEGAALGPMGVIPEKQRQGIGSQLVVSGNRMLLQRGYPFIVVLGHSTYYPRFGYEPGIRRGVACQWKVPDNVFMIRVLNEKAMRGVAGLAQYRSEFFDESLL